jgi:hypothetical protein
MPMPASSGVAQSTASTCDKPVIYLYPQKTQSVKVVLNFLGSLTATYPEYDVKKNGWSVIARQDGTLTDVQDGKEYSYLYWEGLSNKSLDIDYSKGFIVAGKDTRKFMQDTLAKMGLTPKEYNEFIVYWYPRMKDNVFNYIHFAGKPYTDTAKLTITPKPDSMLRVFMAFKPLESATEMKVTAQEFPKFVRKGFVVVEWGGGEVGGPEGMKLGKKIATGSAVNQME